MAGDFLTTFPASRIPFLPVGAGNVYEEYNRSQDDQGRAQNQFVMEKAFEGHPYSRSIIGLPEHLKNPRLSKLIEFTNNGMSPKTWYWYS